MGTRHQYCWKSLHFVLCVFWVAACGQDYEISAVAGRKELLAASAVSSSMTAIEPVLAVVLDSLDRTNDRVSLEYLRTNITRELRPAGCSVLSAGDQLLEFVFDECHQVRTSESLNGTLGIEADGAWLILRGLDFTTSRHVWSTIQVGIDPYPEGYLVVLEGMLSGSELGDRVLWVEAKLDVTEVAGCRSIQGELAWVENGRENNARIEHHVRCGAQCAEPGILATIPRTDHILQIESDGSSEYTWHGSAAWGQVRGATCIAAQDRVAAKLALDLHRVVQVLRPIMAIGSLRAGQSAADLSELLSGFRDKKQAPCASIEGVGGELSGFLKGCIAPPLFPERGCQLFASGGTYEVCDYGTILARDSPGDFGAIDGQLNVVSGGQDWRVDLTLSVNDGAAPTRVEIHADAGGTSLDWSGVDILEGGLQQLDIRVHADMELLSSDGCFSATASGHAVFPRLTALNEVTRENTKITLNMRQCPQQCPEVQYELVPLPPGPELADDFELKPWRRFEGVFEEREGNFEVEPNEFAGDRPTDAELRGRQAMPRKLLPPYNLDCRG